MIDVVIDTNVMISGVFFSGPPSIILDACFMGRHKLVLSPEIIDEYRSVGAEFSRRHPNEDFDRLLALLLSASLLVEAVSGNEKFCVDPDDDKFFHCALAAKATHIVSGDHHLIQASGKAGIHVVRPRVFVEKYIEKKNP